MIFIIIWYLTRFYCIATIVLFRRGAVPYTNETRWTAVFSLLMSYLGQPAVLAHGARPAKEAKPGWRQFLHRGDPDIVPLLLSVAEDLELEQLKGKLDRIMPFTKIMQTRNPKTVSVDFADDCIRAVRESFPEMTKLQPDVGFRRDANIHFWNGTSSPLNMLLRKICSGMIQFKY